MGGGAGMAKISRWAANFGGNAIVLVARNLGLLRLEYYVRVGSLERIGV